MNTIIIKLLKIINLKTIGFTYNQQTYGLEITKKIIKKTNRRGNYNNFSRLSCIKINIYKRIYLCKRLKLKIISLFSGFGP